MVECRIPGHITGLYIFAVVNLCALLNISLVSADVFVIDVDKNSTIDTIDDKQAMFGPDFPDEGLVGRLVYVTPHDACVKVDPPPGEVGLAWIGLVSRGPCHFDRKVLLAQEANYSAVIVHNTVDDDRLVQMAGDQYADQVKIPAVFVGYTDGMALAMRYNYTRRSVVIKLTENSDEPPASFFLPFIVVVSVCFLAVLTFSIVKCIKYFQYIRRTRLSKSALRKIPTRKYKKGDHYDTCAICLEDYEEGEKLRVLPCNHTYHCKCIDPWLTKRKKTCPQCKRRVIPGQETDSDSDGEEEEGASENTPLLGNNNNRRAPSTSGARQPQTPGQAGGSGGLPHPRTSTFDNSGVSALVQPEVMIIDEEHPRVHSANTQKEADSEDTEEEEGEELEGAVGGVGVSDLKDVTNVIVEVEPALHKASSDLEVAAEEFCDPPEVMWVEPGEAAVPEAVWMETEDAAAVLDARLSPVPNQGSINNAFNNSGSSEEEGASGSGGSGSGGATVSRSAKKKKSRRNNQVV